MILQGELVYGSKKDCLFFFNFTLTKWQKYIYWNETDSEYYNASRFVCYLTKDFDALPLMVRLLQPLVPTTAQLHFLGFWLDCHLTFLINEPLKKIKTLFFFLKQKLFYD